MSWVLLQLTLAIGGPLSFCVVGLWRGWTRWWQLISVAFVGEIVMSVLFAFAMRHYGIFVMRSGMHYSHGDFAIAYIPGWRANWRTILLWRIAPPLTIATLVWWGLSLSTRAQPA